MTASPAGAPLIALRATAYPLILKMACLLTLETGYPPSYSCGLSPGLSPPILVVYPPLNSIIFFLPTRWLVLIGLGYNKHHLSPCQVACINGFGLNIFISLYILFLSLNILYTPTAMFLSNCSL
jgi:hypothetical protein